MTEHELLHADELAISLAEGEEAISGYRRGKPVPSSHVAYNISSNQLMSLLRIVLLALSRKIEDLEKQNAHKSVVICPFALIQSFGGDILRSRVNQ